MKKVVVGLGLAVTALAPVWAGRPLQTDDADTLERAACEIEGGHEQRSARDDSSGENALALACGIGFDSQLGLGVVRERGRSDASRGLQLGGKTRLWQAAPEGATLTLAWALGAGRPDGGEWRHEHNDLTLVASLPAGPGQLHLNLGHARDLPSRLVSTPWGIAWEHRGLAWRSLQWAPMAEVFGDDHGSAWWNAGARVAVWEDQLSLNASYGCRWRNERTCLATLGFKLAF